MGDSRSEDSWNKVRAILSLPLANLAAVDKTGRVRLVEGSNPS